RFSGSAAEFARLFPEIAPQVAKNITKVWRVDLPADELRRRAAMVVFDGTVGASSARHVLDALQSFARSKVAKKPNASAAEFAECFPRFAESLTEDSETSWRWRTDVDLSDRESVIAEAFAGFPYEERLAHVRRPEECNEGEL